MLARMDPSQESPPPPVLDLFRVDDHVAVVTGAGRGIGRGIAIALADAGAHVVLTSRSDAELRDAATEIAARGGSASVVAGDITDPAVVDGLVDQAMTEHGRLDVWVSNAGGSEHQGNFSFEDFPLWHWDAQIELNLRPHFVLQPFAMTWMQMLALFQRGSSSQCSR